MTFPVISVAPTVLNQTISYAMNHALLILFLTAFIHSFALNEAPVEPQDDVIEELLSGSLAFVAYYPSNILPASYIALSFYLTTGLALNVACNSAARDAAMQRLLRIAVLIRRLPRFTSVFLSSYIALHLINHNASSQHGWLNAMVICIGFKLALNVSRAYRHSTEVRRGNFVRMIDRLRDD